MPPLTRQQTFGSVRSWWSDSNPNLRGPTINLHAAAKPVMKYLYDRQALEFIKDNRSIRLTSTAAETYGTYLLCEYVSASVKSAILEDLFGRAQSESDASEVHTCMLLQLLEVPGTVDLWFSENIWQILETLASREASAAATCGSLATAICDSDKPQVADGALWVLSRVPQIDFPPDATGVSVKAKLLDHIADMLDAPNTYRWRYTAIFQILSHLARYESSAVAVVEANVLNSEEDLLRSRSTDIYEHIFPMLESLVSHESTATAGLDMRLYDLLVTLGRENFEFRPSLAINVLNLLARIARWRDGAEGVVAAKALDRVLDGLYSSNSEILLSTCRLLQALVGHESTVHSVVAMVPRRDIFALSFYGSYLLSEDLLVRQCATKTLKILDATLERIDGNSRK
ncbi:hypothetical protein C8J57DRAFT_1721178 [Mycena rebaudengoi]|nr:hypothetical protein C8J57DRAFT_1721178 [Mycena rebaudengoi]